MQSIFPGIRYTNGPAAVEWLGKVFGFEPRMVVQRPDGQIAHAEMALDEGLIMLGSGKHDAGKDSPWDHVRVGIYVCVEDVDAHYARAKAAGAEIVAELEDTEYGSRGYSVRDLEGNLWSFGTYRPKV